MGTTHMEHTKYMVEIAKALAKSQDKSMNIVGGGALTRDASGVRASSEFQKVFTFSKPSSSNKTVKPTRPAFKKAQLGIVFLTSITSGSFWVSGYCPEPYSTACLAQASGPAFIS